MPDEQGKPPLRAANDNPPFAMLCCLRTLYAEGWSRYRLFGALDVERCPCCNRAMSLQLRDAMP